MNKIKKAIYIFLSMLLVVSLSGCREIEKAETAVNGVFTAFKSLDFEAAKKYINIDKMSISKEQNNITEDQEIFMKGLFNKLDYKIIKSEKVDAKTVLVTTEITAADIKPVMAEYLQKSFKIVFANAFNSSKNEEDIKKETDKILMECINKPNQTKVSNQVQIKVVKADKEWKIEPDEKFTDALFGGLLSVENEMDSSVDKVTGGLSKN